jgi:Ca2+-binding RTX toxin-like protein
VAALLPTGVTTLYIKGDTTDRVVLRDTWQSGSPVTEGGITYQVFTRNGFNVYAQNGLTGPPTIEGTSSADTIQGGSEAEVINAGEGDNNIAAGGGNDTVNAGSGNDTINAGAGNDTVNTGGGNDDIDAGTGADSILAGDGNDTVIFDAADQLIDGGTGTNVLKINDASVDLTTINNALLTNIQVIDLANSAASTLALAEADVIVANHDLVLASLGTKTLPPPFPGLTPIGLPNVGLRAPKSSRGAAEGALSPAKRSLKPPLRS